MRTQLPLFAFLLALPSCAIPSSDLSARRGTAPPDKSWSQRVSNPVTQPTAFEAPTIQGEIRLMIIHQRLPKSSIFGGGDFQVYAVQVRVPITERLAIIATKDGWIDFNPKSNPVTGGDQEGFADVAAGLKYALYEGEKVLVTPGLVFETTVGDSDVFQGNGDGVFRPFVSAAWEPEPEINVLGSLGATLPVHGAQETQSIDYHLHVDYEVNEWFSPLVEVHGIYYSKNARALPIAFEGGDLINLGAAGVAGQTVVTGAVGARFMWSEQMSMGVAYGVPLTSRNDLYKDRVTIDFTWKF